MSDINKRFPVLGNGWIELQDMMGDDNAIVAAARTSYLGESKGPEKDKALLFRLMQDGHNGPFEHVRLKFRVYAPVLVWWQWVRHRTGSFNLRSGRYVTFGDEFHMPQEWRHNDGAAIPDGTFWTQKLEEHTAKGYQLYTSAMAAGIHREQARLFLPFAAVMYPGVWSTDAHNLMHFLGLRMDDGAQYEIRVYAQAIYEHIFKPSLPWTAEAFEEYRL